MKKFLLALTFIAMGCLNIIAQPFTYYRPVVIPQQPSYQTPSSNPFGSSDDPFGPTDDFFGSRQRNYYQQQQQRQEQPKVQAQIVKGYYFDVMKDQAKIIKLQVAVTEKAIQVLQYYYAPNDTWQKCYSCYAHQLGYGDPKELKELFSYKVSIANIGTVYF